METKAVDESRLIFHKYYIYAYLSMCKHISAKFSFTQQSLACLILRQILNRPFHYSDCIYFRLIQQYILLKKISFVELEGGRYIQLRNKNGSLVMKAKCKISIPQDCAVSVEFLKIMHSKEFRRFRSTTSLHSINLICCFNSANYYLDYRLKQFGSHPLAKIEIKSQTIVVLTIRQILNLQCINTFYLNLVK